LIPNFGVGRPSLLAEVRNQLLFGVVSFAE